MELKYVSPVIERNFRKRYLVNSPSTSLNSENSSSKLHSSSHTPISMYKTPTPSSFLSKLDKDIVKACKINNGEIKKIQDKVEMFLTEVDEKIDFIKAHPAGSKSPIDYMPVKPLTTTPRKIPQPSPTKLTILKRKKKSSEARRSIENLMRTQKDFHNKKSKEELLFKLQKSLGNIRTPCIEDLYSKIIKNEHSFETYKNLRHNTEIDPFKIFNQVCSNEKIPPVPILSKIQDNSLILNRYRISDPMCSALSDALSFLPNLIKIHLDENSMTDLGGMTLLRGLILQKHIKSFYYTHNEIGANFSKVFKEFIISCPLTELNLRGCKVMGSYLFDLIRCLHVCKTMKKLYLSEIGFPNNCVERLSRYVKRSGINELDLSWNQISQEASLKFFKYMKFNKHLTMLDYSWNNLGSEEGDVCIILNNMLMQHPSLMHVNLSYTQINDNNFLSLTPGLQTSKTLVCVHFTGNNISQRKINAMMINLIASYKQVYISDSANRVFHPAQAISIQTKSVSSTLHNVKFRDRTGKCVSSHRDALANIGNSSSYNDRLDGREIKEVIFSRYLGETTIKDLKNWAVSEHCWVCERWVPFTLKISTLMLETICSVGEYKWNMQTLSPIKIKCSFNLWEDIPLDDYDANVYEYIGILPPGHHRFWVINNNSDVCVTKQFTRRKWDGYIVNEITVPIRNYDLEPIEKIKDTPLAFDKNKSVFKNFVEDTEQTRKIMFENDKKHLKLSRIIKDEAILLSVYAVLLSNFAVIKEIFDATSARSNYPNIGWLDFSSFCEQCQLLDNKFLNRSAIDRCFIAVNVDLDDLDDNPQQELCRYEFFEIIVRMAMFKYQDLPLSPAEMTQKLIEEHIFKYSDPSLAIKFRREKLYCNDVNDLLEANLTNCQTLFTKNRERLGRWISLEGYKRMIAKAGFNLKEEDIIKAYAFSKMSILDEMSSADSYDRMVFVEFLESLGRLSNALYGQLEIGLTEMMDKTLEALFIKNGLKKRAPEVAKEENSDDLDN